MSTRRLALAGIVAPTLFAVIVVALTAAEWGEVHELGWSAGPFDDPDAPWPSVTMLTGLGAVMVFGFALLGLATIGLAVALRRVGTGRFRAAIVGLLGAAFAVSAFTIDHGSTGGGGPETWNGTLHAAGLTVVVLSGLGAMLAFAAGRDRVSAAALVAAVACFAVALAGYGNFFAGFLAIVLAWLTLLAVRVLELSQAGSEAASGAPAARPAT